jgi:hypothetical protein
MISSRRDQLYRLWGTVTDVAPGMLKLAGISQLAGVGNEIQIQKPGQTIHGEILSVSAESVTALLFSPCDTIRIGDRVEIDQEARIEPGDHWLGHVINYRGEVAGGETTAAPVRASIRALHAPALPAHARRRHYCLGYRRRVVVLYCVNCSGSDNTITATPQRPQAELFQKIVARNSHGSANSITTASSGRPPSG